MQGIIYFSYPILMCKNKYHLALNYSCPCYAELLRARGIEP